MMSRLPLSAQSCRAVLPLRLSVDVSSNLYQVLGDLVVALVAGDHEAGVAVSVGHLNVCIVLHQILDNLVMSVKASSSQRRRVSLSCAVHIGSTLAEQLDYVQMPSCCSTPQWRSPLYCLPVKCDTTRLLHTGAALVHQVLHHVVVTIPAGENQRGGTISLG